MAALAATAAPATAAPAPATAGVISTIVGGPGGPDPATNVALAGPCGVSVSGGSVDIANGGSVQTGTVQQVTPGTDRLVTLAGTAAFSLPGGQGDPALTAAVGPCGTARDHHGNLVLADTLDQEISIVAHRSGTFYGQSMTARDIYAVAGTGQEGHSGNGGPAIDAELNGPTTVAVDSVGNLVFTDSGNNEIRVVAAKTGTFYKKTMTAGDIYPIVGTGTGGYSGNGGRALKAELNDPSGVTLDAAGNLVIADKGNDEVRVVAKKTGTFYGQHMTAGDIYALAGDGGPGKTGDGGPATSARLSLPAGVTVDAAGNVLLSDSGNQRVRVVADQSGTFYGQAMTAGDIYTIAGDGSKGYAGDGGAAASARLDRPEGLAVDGSGNVLIADFENLRVRVVAAVTGTFYGVPMTAGDIYTIAGNGTFYSGDGGLATSAELFNPGGIAMTPAAGLAVVDGQYPLVQVTAGSAGTFYGRTMKVGDIYHIAGDGIDGYSGDGGPAAQAELSGPSDVTSDAAGNLVITDTGNERIRVVAQDSGTFYGQAMTAGDIYTIAGDGQQGYSGDGGPATAAEFDTPEGVVMDAAGNLVISDTYNYVIRVLAAHTGTFYGQAMTAGDIYTVAGNGHSGYAGDGGPATSAELTVAGGVAVDAAGNLIIADSGSSVIRVVAASTGTFYGQAMTAGDIYTVAGDGTYGYSGDGGPATAAEFASPADVAVDAAGNLVIPDSGNNRVRVVAASTGTFYDVPMTARHIYTVAGDGDYGFTGDGGPATAAELNLPLGVLVNGAGDLLFVDNNRIRKVQG
jgi:trimeric autotransporter adhesin